MELTKKHVQFCPTRSRFSHKTDNVLGAGPRSGGGALFLGGCKEGRRQREGGWCRGAAGSSQLPLHVPQPLHVRAGAQLRGPDREKLSCVQLKSIAVAISSRHSH